MNKINDKQPAAHKWQTHASLELHPDGITGDILEAWLRDALRPLALPADFFSKVHNSVLDTAACIPMNMYLVRWMIFIPALKPPGDPTWGFFRIVKNGLGLDDRSAGPQEFNFYLYAEGSAGQG